MIGCGNHCYARCCSALGCMDQCSQLCSSYVSIVDSPSTSMAILQDCAITYKGEARLLSTPHPVWTLHSRRAPFP